MEIDVKLWKEIKQFLREHKIPYTTCWLGNDKLIQISLAIPNYYQEKIIKTEKERAK